MEDISAIPEGASQFPAVMRNVALDAEVDEPDLADIASKCTLKADGDIQEAAKAFLGTLRKQHRGYYDAMESRVMHDHAITVIRNLTTRMRDSIACFADNGARHRATNPGLTANSLAVFSKMWMDWPVKPGQPLRTATRPQLLEASGRYFKIANTSMARGKLLEHIAGRLKDDKTMVKDALKERDIGKFAKEFGVTREDAKTDE